MAPIAAAAETIAVATYHAYKVHSRKSNVDAQTMPLAARGAPAQTASVVAMARPAESARIAWPLLALVMVEHPVAPENSVAKIPLLALIHMSIRTTAELVAEHARQDSFAPECLRPHLNATATKMPIAITVPLASAIPEERACAERINVPSVNAACPMGRVAEPRLA